MAPADVVALEAATSQATAGPDEDAGLKNLNERIEAFLRQAD